MNENNAKHAALYNFSYMSIGALTPFIGQYLKSMGFSGTDIGTITAIGTAVAIFAVAFWGRCYSAVSKKHELLIFLCLTAAAISFMLVRIKNYCCFAAVFGTMYFFQAPVMSLTDAFTVEHINDGKGFGKMRAWGAVGFAAGVFLTGNAAAVFGISVMFDFYIMGFVIAAAMIFSIAEKYKNSNVGTGGCDNKRKTKEKKRFGYINTVKNKQLRQLILCTFFFGGTNVANNTYFGFLYTDGGGTTAGIGAAMLLMVGSEVPFMAWCEKFSQKLKMERLIMYSMMVSVVRFAVMAMGLPWWALIAISFSQGMVNGILLIEFVRYAARLASEGMESLAISLYYIIGSNFSTIVCQIIGGLLLDAAGARGVYMFFGIFNMTGLLFYIKFRLMEHS